jgi:3-deoxy-manno-octulosonate cytidylyltransferase (CMP-KDO synthetase)
MGIYGYRRSFLSQFVQWPPSPLEITESLEQLRALENDATIHCLVTAQGSPGIDTPEQAAALETLLASQPHPESVI